MKKNVIMITIDAFYYEYLGKKEYKKSATPFLDKLISNKNTVSINKMYSEAPYTEAALMSLLGGIDTADKGSYMKRLKNTDCLLNEYQKEGYTVFANCYQSSIYPSGALTGVNEIFYNSPFNFSNCWKYRIEYFKEKYINNNLSFNEINLIKDILEDNFKEAIEFLSCMKNKSDKVELIYKNSNVDDVDSYIELVNREYTSFKKNSDKYIDNLFKLGDMHPIVNLYAFPWVRKVDKNLLPIIEKKYSPIVRKIFLKNFFYNFKNTRFNFGKFFYLFKNNKSVSFNYFKGWVASIIDVDLMDRVKAKTYNSVKTVASAYTSFEHFKKWCSLNNDKLFFAYLHIDDIHFREMFFTHDTNDLNILEDDFNYANEYIKKLPSNYKGSLCYDLSVHYVDKQLENLFEYLKQNDLLDTTDIIITADHGNSYTNLIPRENFVINFYEENYHVPCIIFSKDKKLNINQNNFYQTKDIPTTILDLNDIEIPKSYKGKSMLNFEGRNYALIEYSGSGCPDILNRPLFLGVRTDRFKVSCEAMLKDRKINIKEVYDLVKDSKENVNLVNSINFDIIEKEIKLLYKEIDSIIESNSSLFNDK